MILLLLLIQILNTDYALQVVKVHQDSVDTYLKDIILVSTERTADHQARREINQLAAKIDRFVYQTQQRSAAFILSN